MTAGQGSAARHSRAVLVVNTLSRTGQEAFAEARERLTGLGVPLAATYPVKDPARLPEAVREALAGEPDLLVLGGGDGTVSSVVDLLAHHHTTLGLLPLGTANDFAKTLEIPAELPAACETVAHGKVVDVDLGLAGDNYFVNVAAAGMAVGVTRALSSTLKKRIGPLAYPVAAARAFFRHRPFRAHLTFPDGDHEPVSLDRLLQVAVGNGRFYGGGAVVAPEAGIDDRRLDVYAIELGRHRDLLGVARYFRSGDFVRQESVTHLTTSRVVLTTDPPQALNVDGEVIGRTPTEFTIAENGLKVVIPQASSVVTRDHQP